MGLQTAEWMRSSTWWRLEYQSDAARHKFHHTRHKLSWIGFRICRFITSASRKWHLKKLGKGCPRSVTQMGKGGGFSQPRRLETGALF